MIFIIIRDILTDHLRAAEVTCKHTDGARVCVKTTALSDEVIV